MCGITGVLTRNPELAEQALLRAGKVQTHRGPDIQDQKVLSIGDWSLGMGHQRLSILDLSDAGRQPMESSSKSSIIAYNGEVYNYKELNEQELNLQLRTGTDTEVVLEMLEKNGIEAALPMFNGMWAFAWYDNTNKMLYLARDRVGVKPLYYTVKNGSLYFASEIKAVLEAVGERFPLNPQVIGEYICQSLQDSSTATFFEGIEALPSGHFAAIDLSVETLQIETKSYWDVFSKPQPVKFDEAVIKARDIFRDSVRLRMRSDVPVGVTLSGGLDSSAIAAIMKEALVEGQELKVLSAVSPGSAQDESEFIDIMADHLGCNVDKISLGWKPEEAIELMRKVTWHNDSPLGSFSNVAHYLMMQKANELGITVILSGQGADELLCGYKKYLGFYIQSLLRKRHYFSAVKLVLGFIFNRSVLNQFSFQEAKRYLPARFSVKEVDIRGPMLNDYKPIQLGLLSGQAVQQRQGTDLGKFSVPYLTHYEDRMSMAWSREIRLPFLDYRLMELFVNLPTRFKLHKGWTKYIFRKAMEDYLPPAINWRKDKQGFVNPQEEWIRSELKDQVLEIFGEDALIFKFGLIDRKALLEKYTVFCEQGDGNGSVWYRDIFNPMALEIWMQTYQKFIIKNA
jgi:asparagine synthase (glutamine-hydrolysing)